MITVKFANGEEKQFRGDAASLSGPVFVLHRRRGKKLQTAKAFSADYVVWGTASKRRTRLGKGASQAEVTQVLAGTIDLTGPFCTIDKGEGIVKAKDLLRTALGSLQEPGVGD